MKIKFFFILFILNFTLEKINSQDITNDELLIRLSSICSTGDDSLNQALEIGFSHLPQVKEIIFTSDTINSGYSSAREFGMIVLIRAVYKNMLSPEEFFELALKYVSLLPSLDPNPLSRNDEIGTFKMNFSLSSFVPDPPPGFVQRTTLTIHFEHTQLILNAMKKFQLISNQGILTSLQQKIENAQKTVEKKGQNYKTTASNQIKATINEVEGQSGKHITVDGADILKGYLTNLVAHIESQTP